MNITGKGWYVDSPRDKGYEICYGINRWRDGPEGTICVTVTDNKADARVIAAAPKMHEILQEWLDSGHMERSDVEKLLSKTRGE